MYDFHTYNAVNRVWLVIQGYKEKLEIVGSLVPLVRMGSQEYLEGQDLRAHRENLAMMGQQ